jgi:AcrR family transcriptional regulator
MSRAPKPKSTATPKANDTARDEVVVRITEAFQAYGFDGASLARISEATGLIKASLYWRFPSGKEAMAEAALARTGELFASYILKPVDETGPLDQRIARIAARLRAFYGNGKKECLLDTLTFAGSPAAVRKQAKHTYEFWEAKFEALASEAGLDASAAHSAAQDAIAALEGALVLARITGEGHAFRRATDSLVRLLGAKS